MFISKLRSNDSVGMVIFENNAKVIFKSTRKDELPTNVFDILD